MVIDGAYINIEILPDVVIHRTLNSLDSVSLRKLRLVSRRTKSWVETPPHLKRLPVFVQNEERAKEILESSVEWNNLIFPLSQIYLNGDCGLLVKSRSYLKSVQFGISRGSDYSNKFSQLVNYFLCNLGPGLESLYLNGEFYASPPLDSWEQELHTLENLGLTGLRHLEFSTLSALPAQNLRPIVKALLNSCPHLTRLRLPVAEYNTGDKSSSILESEENPIFPCLKSFRNTSWILHEGNWIASPRSKLTIDFCSNAHQINFQLLGGRFDLIFPLDFPALLEMVLLCEPIGTLLFNVPLTALPTSEQAAKTLTTFGKTVMRKTIASIISINIKSGLENFYIPPKCGVSLFLEVTRNEPGYEEISRFNLPNDFPLTSLTMFYGGRGSAKWIKPTLLAGFQKFLANLFGVARPTVTELSLGYVIPPEEIELNLNKFSPNLRVLHLCRIGPGNSDFIIHLLESLNGNRTVEELYFVQCTLADDCFLGYYHELDVYPIILNLKGLTKLEIRDCNFPDLTDLTFQRAFSQLRLRTFKFLPSRMPFRRTVPIVYPVQITYEEGFRSLAQGPLLTTLEVFECLIPPDSNYKQMMQFLKRFKYLRHQAVLSSPVDKNTPNIPFL